MILTERLELIPATVELTRAALAGGQSLRVGLAATVPPSWPPQYLDAPALQFTLERLAEGPDQASWWLHFVVLSASPNGRTLVGSAGYKGPPSPAGTVEVGYGIVSEYQRQGYAAEAVWGLLAHAFAVPAVHRVIGETLPQLTASIGVLRKCGFQLVGEGSEPGVIRFALARGNYAAGRGVA
jgi:[ribosomal protein S5]-alanine N-acetyltransferase